MKLLSINELIITRYSGTEPDVVGGKGCVRFNERIGLTTQYRAISLDVTSV